ncbi:hypothetical protein BT67DRAFT_436019 [Trichocladium antarcticum]|uniref:Uncharacterized protein n=1 Tax=Trichocladium antarcticum TaxID=1450529 RepID=A0AAN6UF67_9PEZI|nr:hypothetical protein BT67DRAFT_436019 [Trichocladium antarcticum]
MNNNLFFISWELWQQMTFVLATAIVAVFCAGLARLWWNNRLMGKQEVLDAEKRARVEEMRKTGLPIKRANGVPFGVRAIQSGVEVAGIWISRPASPNGTAATATPPSSSIPASRDADSQDRGVPRTRPSNGSISQNLTDPDPTASAQSVAQSAHNANHQQPRPTGVLTEDTQQRLGRQRDPPNPLYDTYTPKTPFLRSPTRNQPSPAPSSSESAASQPHSTRSASHQKGYTPSPRSLRLHPSLGDAAGHDHHHHHHRRPLAAAAAAPPRRRAAVENKRGGGGSGAVALSRGETRALRGQEPDLAGGGVAEPTFGPGDVHFNRASRRGGWEGMGRGS